MTRVTYALSAIKMVKKNLRRIVRRLLRRRKGWIDIKRVQKFRERGIKVFFN